MNESWEDYRMDSREEAALKEFGHTIPIFEVLADERRQQIMIELTKHAQGLTVSELTKIMQISQPAVSHQLKTLKDHYFVSVDRQGTRNFYRATLDGPLTKVEHLIHTLRSELELKPYLQWIPRIVAEGAAVFLGLKHSSIRI